MVIDAFRLGPWLVEPNLNRVSSAEGEAVLESKAMELLVYLAPRQGAGRPAFASAAQL